MNKQSAAFYNKISFVYPFIDLFLKPQKQILIQEINALAAGKLLELGVGNGKHLHLYKKHNITAIDTSLSMLKLAKKHQPQNSRLLCMNAENLSFENETFDYVILSHVLAVISNPEKALDETYRVLKPGGNLFILNHFTPANGLKHIDHAFQRFARHFHFKSVFYINNFTAIKKFTLVKEINLGRLSYFKLLIYRKA